MRSRLDAHVNPTSTKLRMLAFAQFLILTLGFFGVAATAAPPVVSTVPVSAEDPLQPHDLISGKPTTLKGAVDEASVGSTWTWDPGDGSPSVSGSVNPTPSSFAQTDDPGFTPYFAIWIEHTYAGNDGDLFIATLTVTNGASESNSAQYRMVVRDITLPVEVNVAIDEALWFMHRNQYRFNGAPVQAHASLTAGAIPMSSWNFPQTGGTASGQTTGTAAVVNAFEANGYTATDGPTSPYTETVQRGLRGVIARLTTQSIPVQSFGRPAGSPDDPDTNGNGFGLTVNGHQPPYQLGMAMDAIVASGTPDEIAITGPANVIGRTYRDIVQDMVEWYAWAQGDGTSTGGWRYGPWNNTTGQIDNSTSGWAAIGLLAAEDLFGATVPQWVKTRNEAGLELTDTESNTSTADGRHGYTNSPNPAWGGFGVTGAAMVEMAMDDIESTTSATPDERWIRAENYMRRYFGQPVSGNNLRNYYYAMFNFAKAMRTALPEEVVIIGENNSVGCGPNGGVPGCGPALAPLDWYSDPVIGLARTVVNFQTTSGVNIGMFTDRPGNSQGGHQDEHNTSWATQILTRTLFQAGPVARASASPNPGALNIPISFDATQSFHQDPARSIVLYEWDFDNDGVFDTTGSTAARSFSDTLCPTIPCTLPVTLRVTDDNDPARFDTDIVNVEITIPPHPPTADSGGPYLMCMAEEYPLDGTNSFDIDEGDSETGQPPFDTITAYEWELDGISPFDFDEASGANPLVSFPVPGIRDIGLRVTDNTSQSFPTAGQPDLTDVDFTTLEVADCGCVGPLTARTKPGQAQIVWAPVAGAAGYDILRSFEPNRGFEVIAADHQTDYATYLNRGLDNGTTYWYRVVPKDGNGMAICAFSQAVSATPQENRRARPDVVQVPDVSGLLQSDAENTLAVAGLGTGAVSFENSDTVPEGEVIRTDPAAGSSVVLGTIVDLVVSLGPVRVAVPDVVGLAQADAEAAIVGAGLTVGAVSTANSDIVPAGSVISQDPVGGLLVLLGSAVDFVVSLGPVTVAVPDVVGLPQAAGEAAIVAAGLTVGTVSTANSDTVPAGDVIGQNPAAGTSVLLGTPVDIVVSTGPATVAVPDVIGLPQAFAETVIVGAGLNVGAISTQSSSTVPAGSVIGQSPGAGAQVVLGTAIDLVISLGPVQVTVPDVVGLAQASAEAAIVGANLSVGTVSTANSSTVPAGDVISQNPAGAATVVEGSAVDLVVSLGPVQVTVPDVVGLAQASAEAAIVAANLTVGAVTTANSAVVPAGDVISQNPTGGTVVDELSSVDLVVSLGPVTTTVPDVVGLEQAAAEAAIAGANLTVGAVSTANSNTVPAGDVISQNPVGGTVVAENSAVDLVVSLGPVQVIVPDVVGLSQASAEAAIVAANLTVGAVTTANSDTVPVGDVISQNPGAGSSVDENSSVDIVVSLGPVIVAVPNVVGLPQATAEADIVAAGLTVGAITTQNDAVVPAGNVISQDPSVGATLPEGSPVDLVISLGPVQVTVPDVVGLSQANAEAAIIAASLTVGAVTAANSDTVPAGDVISQNPAAGASVDENSAVDIVVSLGPAVVPVTVPDVVGLSQAAAEAAIVAANLTVGAVSTANSDTVPVGDVISQNPPAGSSVAENSPVDLVVSLGPVTVTVPDVVGLTEAGAVANILAANLTVGTISTQSSDTVPAGDVISQDPAAGSSVAEGSAVDLVVSTGPAAAGDTLTLSLSTSAITAGDSITVTPSLTDINDDPVIPAPLINYVISFTPGEASGTSPTEAGAVISTSADTRGVYTVTGTVDGATTSASEEFVVFRPAAESGQKALQSALGTSVNSISSAAAAIEQALADGNIAGVQAALNDMRAARDAVDRFALRRTTAFAPEGGFLPSTAELTAAGFPQTADDVTLQIVINNIAATIQQTSAVYSTLNAAGGIDDDVTLANLNADLQALLDQLNGLNPTVNGWVEAKGLVNYLYAVVIPEHLYAVVDRYEQAIVAEGIGVVQNQLPLDMYRNLDEATTPEEFYADNRDAFFTLSGMSVAVNIQMKIISNVYGPMLHDLARSAALLVANDLLNEFVNNLGLPGIKTGASLSIHVFNQFNSWIEVVGANPSIPGRSDVWLVGTAAIAAVENLFTALDPSDIEDLDDVWEFFEGVVDAIEGAGEAAETANQQASSVFPSCIFSSDSRCVELVYPSGFNAVNECSGFICVPQPVLILVHNLDTGTWAFDLFSFNPP